MKVSEDKLAANFREGIVGCREPWEKILSLDIFDKVLEIGELSQEQFDFPTHLWAKALYDYAVCHHRKTVSQEDLLRSLIPLYLGKTLSYVRKTKRMSVQQAEEFIENECMIFEETKPYLLDRWGE